jgi:hypothetical protein
MNGEITAPLVALAATGLAQLGGLLVWGATLSARVKTIEREIEPLKALSHQVTRMETRLDLLLEQFRDLNASIRWMRDPAADSAPRPGRPPP